MTSAVMGSTILISGLTLDLTEDLEHPLLVKLSFGGTNVTSMLLKRSEKHIGIRSFQKPQNLREGSILTVQVQEKHRDRNDKTLVHLNLSLGDIWQGLNSGTPESQAKRYEIRLNDPKKRLWLNLDVLIPAPQVGTSTTSESFDDASRPLERSANSPKIVSNTTVQELRATKPIALDVQREETDPTKSLDLQELKNRLLEGIKLVSPQATECLEGTRTTILANVTAHIDDRDGANAIWIRGAPGSGKSSISLTAKSQLRSLGRLVTYFRFDRNQASTTTPTALWRQVAYDLACLLPSVRARVLQQLRDDNVDLDSPMDVFTFFVEAPLMELRDAPTPPDHPLVIIIDALDECGGYVGYSSLDRQMLLRALGRWHKLPRYVRLLLTSREEGDISRVLSTISTPMEITSGHPLSDNPKAQASIEASDDIRTFLEHRFSQITRRLPMLGQDWPGTHMITEMIDRAAGNFMWVTTATAFIDTGLDPQDRLDRIMADIPQSRGMRPLYSLYSTILDTSFGNTVNDDYEAVILRAVLGTMVFAKQTLSDDAYTKLPTPDPISPIILQSIRESLGSVIGMDGNLQFVHKSFDDFLLSEECPSRYRVTMEDSQYLLTQLCLITMLADLRFNICGLETSCLKNTDVPNLETKVANGISELLSYSCRFWADHLRYSPFDEYLMSDVKRVILYKLLYWFEAMSLLRELNQVSPSLLLLLKWTHPSPDEEFKELVRDARLFIGAFAHPIAQSTPHIYVSALPFAPKQSLVAQHFLSQFPRTLAVPMGRSTSWSSCIFTSERHTNYVNSVAFSSDDKYFVSGSTDRTVCICDSETGNLIMGPFNANSIVTHVFLHPNGRQVWAACQRGMVIGWDIHTGDKLLEFLAGGVWDIMAFSYSNGGQNLITASRKSQTVTFWDAHTGERLRDLPFQNNVQLVSFSPDGLYMIYQPQDASDMTTSLGIRRLVDGSEIRGQSNSQSRFAYAHALSFSADGNFAVSGLEDGTVLVWDATTGDTIGRPLHTSKREIMSIAYSPQTKLVVSTSGNHDTATVWDASTCEAVLGPLDSHAARIVSIALSHNGQRALTASWDNTVKMWDLGKRGLGPRGGVNKGHRGGVMYITLSPCGKKLASVGEDQTIRIWDADTGRPLFDPIDSLSQQDHALFSPDGNQIVAYYTAEGCSLRVWNVGNGMLLFNHNLGDGNHRTRIYEAAFRSTDHRLVTCLSNGVVRVWSIKDGVMTEDLSATTPQPTDASKSTRVFALSPDGLTAIVRDELGDKRHYIWSTTTYRPVSLTLADDQCLLQVNWIQRVYSHDRRLFAAVSRVNNFTINVQSTLRVWNMETGKLVMGPSTFNGKIHCLEFSPDDRYIVFAWNSSAVWTYDTHTGRLGPGPWNRHIQTIWKFVFSLDGKKLISCSDDQQIRFWNTADLLVDSQVSDGELGVGTCMKDGWVMDADGNLLFWIPRDNRERLVWPGTTAIGDEVVTELDLSRFKYGEQWTECIEGGYQVVE